MAPDDKMLHRRLVQIILLCGVAIIAATMVVSWSELVEQGRQVLQVLHTSEPLLDRLDRVVDPCPALLPSFTFPIPVDHRRFHGKRNSSQPCRFVVVTTVTGAYDKVDLSFPQTSGPNLCFFIFFDEASARASVPEAELENACFLSKSTEVSSCVLPRLGEWHVVILSDSMISSIPPPFARTRRSRLMKMLSHRAFSSAEFLLYVDGKLIINDVTPETVEAFVLPGPLLGTQHNGSGVAPLANGHCQAPGAAAPRWQGGVGLAAASGKADNLRRGLAGLHHGCKRVSKPESAFDSWSEVCAKSSRPWNVGGTAKSGPPDPTRKGSEQPGMVSPCIP